MHSDSRFLAGIAPDGGGESPQATSHEVGDSGAYRESRLQLPGFSNVQLSLRNSSHGILWSGDWEAQRSIYAKLRIAPDFKIEELSLTTGFRVSP